MVCKDQCKNYDTCKKSSYSLGFKHCTTCEVYIKWEGIRCPCCCFKLRTKSRNMVSKRNYEAKLGVGAKRM